MSATELETALRMACRELAGWRYEYSALPGAYDPSEADVDDVVTEMLEKARGFDGEAA